MKFADLIPRRRPRPEPVAEGPDGLHDTDIDLVVLIELARQCDELDDHKPRTTPWQITLIDAQMFGALADLDDDIADFEQLKHMIAVNA